MTMREKLEEQRRQIEKMDRDIKEFKRMWYYFKNREAQHK